MNGEFNSQVDETVQNVESKRLKAAWNAGRVLFGQLYHELGGIAFPWVHPLEELLQTLGTSFGWLCWTAGCRSIVQKTLNLQSLSQMLSIWSFTNDQSIRNWLWKEKEAMGATAAPHMNGESVLASAIVATYPPYPKPNTTMLSSSIGGVLFATCLFFCKSNWIVRKNISDDLFFKVFV